ncbi:MAG: zinc-dependent metalloprotease family protein [Chitinophagaceae bacterium]
MRKLYKLGFTVFALLLFSQSIFSQNRFFSDAGQNATLTTAGERIFRPDKYRASTLDAARMKTFLWSLPSESMLMNRSAAPVIELPMPDGKMARFHVWESSVMQPGLAAKYPEIKTFLGQGIDDPYASVRLDYNPYFGFHAQILSPNGRVFIDPYARYDINNYVSYYSKDQSFSEKFICNTPDPISQNSVTAGPCRGTQLLTYRLALACTGEYAVAVAGASPTVPAVLAAMVTAVNRVTGVYELEVSVRLSLIPNDDLLIYLNGATDPYTNNSGGTMLGQNQANIDAIIGNANYDIGHVFSTGGGGIAGLGVVCITGNKARGVTGLSNPVGDDFYIDYVAHEMGHQFGGNHTFNSVTSNCGGGNRNNSTAYEVGSGTTIQAYAGICGADDIQPHSDPYFHTVSFDEIGNYITSGSGGSCPVSTSTGNTLPVITAMNNNGVSIPIGTPFTLSGSATDANGDALTYSWEEWDLGTAGAWNNGATSTTAPLFKSRIPKTTGERTFPDIAVILAGYPANPPSAMGGLKGETLPQVARAMKFRLTVRDNRAGGGGVVTGGDGCQAGFTGTFQINTVATPGPFAVTIPNGGESWQGGSSQTITWNVVGTDAAPINTANVKISLSTDGGLTYPTVIAASTPNDGSETLTIPAVPATTTARVKIEAIGNIFFDISNANFTITIPPSGFTFNTPTPATASCPAPASMATNVSVSYNGGFTNTVSLSASGNPGGTTVSFGSSTLTPGAPSTSITLSGTNTLSAGTYNITVTGTATGAPQQTVTVPFIINPGAGPTITGQPVSIGVCQGSPASFAVIASGSGLSYQWQKSTDGGTTWINIGGATSTSYTIASAQPADAGQYRCVVSSLCGSTNSNAATLTVNTPPAITTQPADITLCAGANNTFTVAATGASLTYQWQSATSCAGPWSNIGGATNSSLTVTAGTTTSYRCVVTGTCTPAATSNCATLTVVTAVSVTTQPTNQTVCAGSNTSFTANGSGSGVIFQWQLSTDGGTTWNNISNGGVYGGATTGTLTITGATVSMNNYQYRCSMTNASCTTPGISNAAVLTVNTLPSISAQPANATICVGSGNTFSVTAAGTGVTYQWQLSTDGGATFNNIAGATTSTYAVTNATIGMNNYRYHCVVSGTCLPQLISNDAILTVIAPVTISTQPANAELCSGSNTSFTVAGNSVQPIIYQWQLSTDGGTTWNNVNNGGVYSGATTATLTITGATTALSTGRYRCLLSNATCTTPAASNGGILTVRQLPTVGLTASLTSLLPGKVSVLTATPSASTGGTLAIGWFFNNNTISNTGNTRTVNIEQVGSYQVRIAETWPSSLVCANQSPVVTIDATVSDKLFIFPSPNDGRFTVSYYNSGGVSTQRRITIFDSKGAKVYDKQFSITGAYTLLPIDLRNGSRGIYYVLVGDAAGNKLVDGKVHVR